MTMPRRLVVQQGTDAAPVKTPAEDWRLGSGGLWAPSSVSLQARAGVVAGSAPAGATRPLDVVAAAGGVFTVYPGHFVLQGGPTNSGAYMGVVDAATVRTIPGGSLPPSGQFKAGYLLIHVYDQNYGDTKDDWDIEFLLGASATTANGAVYPAFPVGMSYLQLRAFTVSSTGAVTMGSYLPSSTVARGGIVPVPVGEAMTGSYGGQYRDKAIDATSGMGRLERYNKVADVWEQPISRYWGTLSPNQWPAPGTGAQYGDKLYCSEIGCIFVYNNGTTWYQDSAAIFTSYAQMETKRTAFEAAGGVLHNGFLAFDSTRDRLYAAMGGSGTTPPWRLIGGAPGAVQTPAFVTVAGWTIAVSEVQNLGDGTAFAHVDVTKTGSAVTVSATGTIPNGAVAGLPSGWEALRNVPLTSFGVGRLTGGYLSSSGGAFNLSAVAPGGNIAVGESLSLATIYPLANPLAVAAL
jgi:hypothetical protein